TDAMTAYQRGWEHAVRAGSGFLIAAAAASLAMILAIRGEHRRAEQWLERCDTHSGPQSWMSYLAAAPAHLARATGALDKLDALVCREELALVGDGTAAIELWPHAAYLHAQYALHFGSPRAALGQLDIAADAHRDSLGAEGAAAAMLLRARADLLTAI